MRLLLLVLAVLVAMPAAAQTHWHVDRSHSSVEFSVRRMVISRVTGQFCDFHGLLTAPSGDGIEGARAEGTIEVVSVDTGNGRRNAHLLEEDFFHADEHPTITFRSGPFERVRGDRYRAEGRLTMPGVTRPITLDVEYGGQARAHGQTKMALTVSGDLDRTDYGLRWNDLTEAGGVMVGDEVRLTLNLELIRRGS